MGGRGGPGRGGAGVKTTSSGRRGGRGAGSLKAVNALRRGAGLPRLESIAEVVTRLEKRNKQP